jgi:allantoinase
LLVRAPRAVVGGLEQAVDVGVANGKIVCVRPLGEVSSAVQVKKLTDAVVLLPGFVDSHVHINEPGHPDWEGFDTATRAAAAAGITTLVDMPLDSSPVTTTVGALEAKRHAAGRQCRVDVGLWAGVVPSNLGELSELYAAGALGFKCFLTDSGNPEFPPLTTTELLTAMAEVAGLDALLLVHAESQAELARYETPSGRSYQGFLDSRPNVVEDRAIAEVIAAARRTGARTHIVHLSSATSLPLVSAARADGIPITAETCPHYLTLSAEFVPDGATEFAACPPIRTRANGEALWQALRDGLLDMVVSDHSPCAVELKHSSSGSSSGSGDFGVAWGGISSLQLGPAVVWTSARERGFTLADLVNWMSERPAACAGLPNKGRLAVGADADFVVFDPEAQFMVDPALLQHRQPLTPYTGRRLTGTAHETWLRGKLIATGDGMIGKANGELLSRPAVELRNGKPQ